MWAFIRTLIWQGEYRFGYKNFIRSKIGEINKMAQRSIASSIQVREHLFGEECFWTINKNVGYGYQNLESDVRLVQFFLNASSGGVKLTVDGKFGGKTWNAIKQFQSDMRQIPDGMISAVSGDKLRGSTTGRVYTMFELNQYYRHRFPQYFNDLTKDPNLPTALRQHFTVPDWVFDNGVC